MSLSARRIGLNISLLFVGNVLARVASAVTQILIARTISIDAFGQYAATFAIAKISSMIFSLGLDIWLLRNADRTPNSTRFAQQVTSCFAIKILVGSLWFVGIYFFSAIYQGETFSPSLLLLTALVVWIEELLATILSAFKAHLQNVQTTLLLIFSELGVLVITVGIKFAHYTDANSFVAGQIVAASISVGIGLLLLARMIRPQLNVSHVLQTVKETTWFGMSIFFAKIYGQADVTIAAIWLDKHTAGLYSAATTILSTLFLIPAAAHDVLLPELRHSYQQNQTISSSLMRNAGVAAAAAGLVLSLATALFAGFGIRLLYGADFAPAQGLLLILSSILFFRCISFVFAALITAVGWQQRRVVVQGIVALANVAFNLMVVQWWGITGIAWIYVLTDLMLMGGYLVLAYRWFMQGSSHAWGEINKPFKAF